MVNHPGTDQLIRMQRLNCCRFLSWIFGLFIYCATVLAAEPVANSVGLQQLDTSHEKILIAALENISQGDIDAALGNLGIIVKAYPNYRLAQLVYADLLMAKSRPIRDFGNFQSAPYEQIAALLDEARTRWQYHHTPPPSARVPASLVKLSENQKYAVVVDMKTSRLYLYRNQEGIPRLVFDFYATIGKNGTHKLVEGDQKTPVGVYFVTGFIDPEKLPDFYGTGAFPIDYPNVWDKRHGRTGSGIWLHGTPSYTLNRPPRDSDGCVILSNNNLDLIAPYLEGETPVILSESIEWVDQKEWLERQAGYATLVEQWRQDWESRDPGLYLSHYSPDYSGLGMDYNNFVDYKKKVNLTKNYIKVGITEKSIFMYPGESDLIVVTFRQQYQSDSVVRDFVKRQYWRMEQDGQWRIVYEGSVS